MTAANDNAPLVTPGVDGLRIWSAGKIIATGLSALQAMRIMRRLTA